MLDWSQIEKYYDQGDTAGFALAILESEKLLREVLHQKKTPGKDFDQKLELTEKHLSSPQSLKHARQLTHELLELRLPRNIGKQTTEQILRVYFSAITELSGLSSLEVSRLKLKFYSRKIQGLLGRLLIYLILALIAIIAITLLLADTETGKNVTAAVVKLAHLTVYRMLPMILVAFTIIVIGIGVSLNRKSKRQTAAKATNTPHE